MSKKRIAQYCCAALVAAGVGLNIQNAIADYGIGENSLSLVAVGPGSNSSNTYLVDWNASALDSNSNTYGVDQPVTCYNTITTDLGSGVYYCSGCLYLADSKAVFYSGTDKCNP